MVVKTPEEILGFEFDWLASDVDGHVALFSTAGGGYAPPEFLEDTDAHDRAISSILALPTSTNASSAPTVAPGLQNIWQEMAERGVFAFDADAHGGPYRSVASPVRPTHVSTLPKTATRVLQRLQLQSIRFSEIQLVLTAVLRNR